MNSLTKACAYRNDKITTRLPIQKPLMHRLLQKYEIIFRKDNYMITLHQAILSLGYFGLMCVGEMGASEHCLKAKDVHIVQNKRKLMIILHTSKTHWKDNKPQVIKISSARKEEHKSKQNYHFCPYNILRTFV